MDAFLQWLSSGSAPATIIVVALGIVVIALVVMYVIAFIQGREVSFWPPKIGAKEKVSNNRKEKISKEQQKAMPAPTAQSADKQVVSSDSYVIFLNQDKVTYDCVCPANDPEYIFRGALYGHLANFGAQVCIVEEFSCKIGVNDLFDRFILERMKFALTVSSLYEGQVSSFDSIESRKRIELPRVLQPSEVQLFSLVMDIRIPTGLKENNVMEVINWIKYFNVDVTYRLRRSDGAEQREVKIKVSTGEMFDAALASKRGVLDPFP